MAAYDTADFTQRLITLLPQSWFSDSALNPGGNLYALMTALALPLVASKQQIDYAMLQTRLLKATDTNLEAIAADFFGPSYGRGLQLVANNFVPETDYSFARRIQNDVIAPRNTLAAIQARVQSYINQFYLATSALNSQLLGMDTAGGLDSWGALDGRPNNLPALPQVTAFDLQSNPKLAASISLQPGQFCLLFSYGGLRTAGFFAGRSHVSRETGGGTFLLNDVIHVLPAPLTPALGALVNGIKATAFQPIYADNRS